MEITYKNAKLQKLCERQTEAKRKLGADNARQLKARIENLIKNLINAKKVTNLAAGSPHPLTGDRLGQFALSLVGPKRLVFEPDSYPIPLKEDGSIDWSEVTKIIIIEIVDYHD